MSQSWNELLRHWRSGFTVAIIALFYLLIIRSYNLILLILYNFFTNIQLEWHCIALLCRCAVKKLLTHSVSLMLAILYQVVCFELHQRFTGNPTIIVPNKKAVLLHYVSGSNEPLRRYGLSKLSKMPACSQLGFNVTGNSAIWSADPENPTLEPNMKCIGSIWNFPRGLPPSWIWCNQK